MGTALTLTFGGYLTIAVVVGAVILMATDRFPSEGIMMGGLVVLLAFGVLPPEEAFLGFANPAVLALAGLYVLTSALRETGALDLTAQRLLASVNRVAQGRRRLTLVAAPLSAFLNNTPVVAMLMPLASTWARRRGVSVRGLLLPLSYAAVLGGTCTLLGTATHLVVHGLLVSRGLPGLGVFELLPIGLAMTAVGLPTLWWMATRYLKEPAGPEAGGDARRREYTTDLLVPARSPLIGKTVEEADLRHLEGLFLIRIERAGRVIAPVGPGERLLDGDRLSFAGILSTIVDLQRRRGLEPAETDGPQTEWVLHEAVVSRASPLVGKSIREANFRGAYNAAVVAVHRHGGAISKKLGDIVLRHGDTLLLQAAPGFARSFRDVPDFYLISEVEDASRPRHGRALVALAIMGGMVVVAATGAAPLATAALAAAMLAVALGCTSFGAARRAIDLSVLVVIAAAMGLARAFEVTGVAEVVAQGLGGLAMHLGPVGMLAAVSVLGMVLTEFITNTAAAALLLPIALAMAAQGDLDYRPFVLATSISAAVSLSTPLGYQTNMMVYGPGGYRFMDFVRMGVPIQLLCGSVAVAMLSWLYDVG
jgi:di/tricarboxylate transporter